ncbi:hypothetical protein sscle_08g065350 [Sclerotinia sclerotiorum 1980 UF-70]|uniref:Uncharacterized protein n=1 Tax=Sclerotinia sclerotiorum (strain ATCC 18683 / 1980 / Ss-1) TaxID=665079 RepID=A0A1D9QA06_SCLS1|nr:hypothetical protein sscle_08g065350 [Sclerotinia sclerotiorum 1980 UF-70]
MRAVRVRDVNSKQFASMSLFLPIPTNQIESFIAKFQAIQAKLPSQPRKYKNRRRNPNRGGKKEENVVLVMITGSSSNKLSVDGLTKEKQIKTLKCFDLI